MAGAFGDDGGRLHLGGDRVGARTRRSLGGQLIGTGFPHARTDNRRGPPTRAVRNVVRRMVPTAFFARLMPSLRGPGGLPPAALLAVDVAAIVGLAAIEDATATCSGAPNLDEYRDDVHERAALGTCPASPTSGTFAPSASMRDRRLGAATLGLRSLRCSPIVSDGPRAPPLPGREPRDRISTNPDDRQHPSSVAAQHSSRRRR
jgi:hypothetical protein